MNSISLGLAYLRYRLLSTVLNILVLACGVALIVSLLLLNHQFEDQFSRNLKGVDLVVGAKGSPLQLILSSVFHIDIPTGNIPLEEAEKLEHHPLVQSAIPVALGDNYNGFYIVGTDAQYIRLYGGELAQGNLFNASMEAVLGSEVAQKYHHKPGDKIVGAHGLVNSDDLHSDFPYVITGILKSTGTVLDRLVLTPVDSVWHVHEHPDADDPEEVAYKKEHPGKELTALLITYKTPLAAVRLPREVNKTSSMQSASPAFETARLMSFMSVGTDTLKVFGGFLMALAGFSIFVTLYNTMNERRYDLALMRSFGASPAKLFGLVLTESIILAAGGSLLGLMLGHILTGYAAYWLAQSKHVIFTAGIFLSEEIWLVAAAIVIGVVAALIPAIKVYSINVAEILSKGS